MARTRLLIVAVAVAVVVVIGLMRPPGSARSDEVADVVTNAISYPPKGSAAGLARAAQNTGSVIVYTAEDLAPDAPGRADARLGFRVDYLVRRSVFDFDQWNPDLERRHACYEAEFGYQYVADLRRVWCPQDTVPIHIPSWDRDDRHSARDLRQRFRASRPDVSLVQGRAVGRQADSRSLRHASVVPVGR